MTQRLTNNSNTDHFNSSFPCQIICKYIKEKGDVERTSSLKKRHVIIYNVAYLTFMCKKDS